MRRSCGKCRPVPSILPWVSAPVTDAGDQLKFTVDSEANSHPSERDRARQRQLRLLGIFILTAGLLAAIGIRLRAAPDDGAADVFRAGTLLSGNAKRYENEMKSIGGQSNVMAAEFRDWFASLWHGRRLASTVAFLTVGGSLACFLLAQLLNESPAPENQSDGLNGPDRGAPPRG